MRIWRTAIHTLRCGYDGEHRIAKDELYLEIEDGAGKKRVRCTKCAARHEAPVVTEAPVEAIAPAAEPEPAPAEDLDPEFEGEPDLASDGEPW